MTFLSKQSKVRMMFEIDTRKLKVICQKCGKTGIHDVTISEKESGWSWMRATKGSITDWDCFLCLDCANEISDSLSETKIGETE